MSMVCGGSSTIRSIARIATMASAVSLTLLLGACSQNSGLNLGLGSDEPKSVDIATASSAPSSEAELAKATAYWGEQHTKNPRDAKSAINYARNLKAMGRKPNALAALQSTYVYAPDDKELMSEYGRLALELGQVSTAEQLLIRAEEPGKPDWRLISARGTVLAKQGRFSDAIPFYEKALAIAPQQASLMNNLAMAYTMNGEAARGEALLRKAADSGTSDPRVQKNLELVKELQGRGSQSGAQTAAAAPISGVASPSPAPAQNAAWDRALPIEQAAAPQKVASRDRQPAKVSDDDIVRRAMEAEYAKTARR